MRRIVSIVCLLAATCVSADEPPAPAAAPVSDSADIAASDPKLAEYHREFDRKLRDGLNKLVSVEFEETEMVNVLASFQEMLDLNVVVDWDTMLNEGIEPDTRITLVLRNVPVESALKHALRPRNLTWLVYQDVVFVTTATAADEDPDFLMTQVYDVGDLLSVTNQSGKDIPNFEELAELLKKGLSAQWNDDSGYGGGIVPFQAKGINALVVRQTYQVHLEIERLLLGLRAARHVQPTK